MKHVYRGADGKYRKDWRKKYNEDMMRRNRDSTANFEAKSILGNLFQFTDKLKNDLKNKPHKERTSI